VSISFWFDLILIWFYDYTVMMDSRQFISGSVAGCVGQIIGHPLDSIKVVMQTSLSSSTNSSTTTSSSSILSARRTAIEMYNSQYGIKSFFRGLSLPLMTKSIEQCIAFGIKGTVQNFLEQQQHQHQRQQQKSSSILFYNNIEIDDSYKAGLSGCIAGACTSLILTPVYLVKVQLQATTTIAATATAAAASSIRPQPQPPLLTGPIMAIKTTVSRLGWWKGMYTGALPTFLGTSIGYGFRFATYDKTVYYIEQIIIIQDDDNNNNNNNNNSKRKNILPVIIGGGLAGMATWLSHYPLDLVANKMMADVILTSTSTDSSSSSSSTTNIIKKQQHKNKNTGMINQFRIIYQQYGFKGYFRGIGPCLLRAFPVNAAIFVSYEFCMGNIWNTSTNMNTNNYILWKKKKRMEKLFGFALLSMPRFLFVIK
jgi:hypothetical protein